MARGGEGNQSEVMEGLTSPVQKIHLTVVIAEEEEKVVGEGESVVELRQQLCKVTKEKEQLRQTNAALQKTLSGLQKQVLAIIMSHPLCLSSITCASLPPSLPPSLLSFLPASLPHSLSRHGTDTGGGGGEEEWEGEGNKESYVYAQVDIIIRSVME